MPRFAGGKKSEVSHKIHSAKGEVYEDEVIILAELLGESHHTIEECVFRSCLIKGPVLIVLEGNVQFQGKGDVLADSVEDILYEVDEGRKLSGAIKVLSCTFRDCRFQQCGFVGTKTQMDVLRKIFARS